MARFMRRHEDAAGSHIVVTGENADGTLKDIRLEGRQIYETDSKRDIEILRADPEVVELDKKTTIEPNE